MSNSYHVTIKDLRGKTKAELDAMADESDSILHEWAEKSRVKKEVKKQRRAIKEKERQKSITND